jgi:hypothetical protein
MSDIVKRLSFRYATISFFSHMLFIFIVTMAGSRLVPLVVGDSVSYKMDAENILDHGAFSRENVPPYLWEPYRTPGYPLLIVFSEGIFGNDKGILLITAAAAGIASWVSVQMAIMLGAGRLGQHVSGWVMALLPNSLGLSAFLLTDAIFGYLFLLWIYLLYTGFYYHRKLLLVASAVILSFLQSIKPTANLGILFILGIAVFFAHSRKQWIQTGLLTICAVVMPLTFAFMNFRDHGIFSPSLLGVQAVREYLEVNYHAQNSGQSIMETTEQIRLQDAMTAMQLTEPKSYYGRLYKIEQAAVFQFLQQDAPEAARLMAVEMIRQFAAPQEFTVLAFMDEAPVWMRIFGSLLSILLWTGAFLGAWNLAIRGMWPLALLLIGTLAFFLITGSVSHLVGARLRFPADLLAVPYFAYGISVLFQSRTNGSLVQF